MKRQNVGFCYSYHTNLNKYKYMYSVHISTQFHVKKSHVVLITNWSMLPINTALTIFNVHSFKC